MAERDIHRKIIKICEFLRTDYKSKKHGGYNIFDDGKLHLEVDTYVPNCEASIILPSGIKETAFSCSYSCHNPLYHKGKWTDHLEILYQRALEAETQQTQKALAKKKASDEKRNAPTSDEANEVFN